MISFLESIVLKYGFIIDNLQFCTITTLHNVVIEIITHRNVLFETKNDTLISPTIYQLSKLMDYKKDCSNQEYIDCSKQEYIAYICLVYLIVKYNIKIESKDYEQLKTLYYQTVSQNNQLYTFVEPENNSIIDINHRYSSGLRFDHFKKIITATLNDINLIVCDNWYIPLKDYGQEESDLIKTMKQYNSSNNTKLSWIIIYLRFQIRKDSDSGHCNAIVYNPNLDEWIRIESHGVSLITEEESPICYHILDLHIKHHIKNYKSHNDYYYLPGIQRLESACVFYTCILIEEYIRNNNIYEAIENLLFIDYARERLKYYILILDQINSKK